MNNNLDFEKHYRLYSEKIQTLNEIKFKSFEKYNCGFILAEVIGFVVTKKQDSLFLIIKRLLFLFFFDNQDFIYIKKNSSILFYGTYKRFDHRERMAKVASTCRSFDWCESCVKKRKLTFNKINCIGICFLWLLQMSSLQDSLLSKLMYIARLLSAKAFLDSFQKNVQFINYNLLVTLADFQLQANVLTQFFSLKNIATATLQDGNPIKMPEFITAPQQFMPAFNAFVSDYYLAWGDYYKEVAVSWGMNKDKVISLGMPKYIDKTTKPILNIKSKIFAVLLDNVPNIDNNISLIKDADYIAEKMNMKYIIRLHPASDLSLYEKYKKNKYCHSFCQKSTPVSEFLEDKAFAIGCCSAVLIEGMLSCAIVLRRLPNISFFDYLKDVGFPLEYSSKEEAHNLVVNAFYEYGRGLELKLKNYREKMCGSGDIKTNYSKFTHYYE
jgi:hypothetical protein